MSDIKNVENIENIDIEIKPTKKKKNRPYKYTEEERKQRAKEAQKRFFSKIDIKAKYNEYYKERYKNLSEEDKKKYMQPILDKYYTMNEEEHKAFLYKCKMNKRAFDKRKREQKELAKETANNSILS